MRLCQFVWYNYLLLLQDRRPARRAAHRYFVYSVVQKPVFRPQGATHYTDKREIRLMAWGTRPNFTFIEAEMWEHSPQNRLNLEFCP